MEYIDKKDLFGIFTSIRDVIRINRDELIRLDSELGDGDLGLTMVKGFDSIVENLGNYADETDIGKLLKKAGFIMSDAVPSTMGTFLSIAILKSGDAVKGKDKIEPADMPVMLRNAIDAMVQRGKAKKRGDKTILDALFPALDELEAALSAGKPIKDAVGAAYTGAKRGTEETKKMKSTVGKAAVYQEQSIGKQDPGATVGMYIFEGIYKYLSGQKA